MFTDIVGSTDLLSRLGDAKWETVRRAHFTSLRDLLAEHSGVEVKNTGDGVMASFGSVVDAIDCSIAMQRRVQRDAGAGSPVAIRIGLATGEANNEHGDWFGTPVVEAARLCALAEPGSTWATTIVRALAGSSSAATFDDIGPTLLKGFDRPVDVVAIIARARRRLDVLRGGRRPPRSVRSTGPTARLLGVAAVAAADALDHAHRARPDAGRPRSATSGSGREPSSSGSPGSSVQKAEPSGSRRAS